MKLLNAFLANRRGSLIQVIIAVIILGALSYSFWTEWSTSMRTAGEGIKTKIQADHWLE